MYHITKAGSNQFLVILLNEKNREVLSTSELLSSKQKAFENVVAQMAATIADPYVQDDTLKYPKVYYYFGTAKHLSGTTPTARYVVKGRRGK